MICIYHSRDLDGWMSAAIVKLKFPKVELIGWDYGDSLPELNPEFESDVIMTDICFPAKTMDAIQELFDLTWIDHHISAIKEMASLDPMPFIEGMRNEKFAACELAWKYFFPDKLMPAIVRVIGRYDCFGHKGTDEEQKVLEFQYAARAYWKNVDDCYEALRQDDTRIVGLFSELGKGIYKYLCTEAQQIYARKFTMMFDTYKFACVNQERFNPINFGIDYHKDGYDGFACFHYQDGKWKFSLYNDNGNVDCSDICKSRGGGGHKGAAGFILTTDQFVSNL